MDTVFPDPEILVVCDFKNFSSRKKKERTEQPPEKSI